MLHTTSRVTNTIITLSLEQQRHRILLLGPDITIIEPRIAAVVTDGWSLGIVATVTRLRQAATLLRHTAIRY